MQEQTCEFFVAASFEPNRRSTVFPGHVVSTTMLTPGDIATQCAGQVFAHLFDHDQLRGSLMYFRDYHEHIKRSHYLIDMASFEKANREVVFHGRFDFRAKRGGRTKDRAAMRVCIAARLVFRAKVWTLVELNIDSVDMVDGDNNPKRIQRNLVR